MRSRASRIGAAGVVLVATLVAPFPAEAGHVPGHSAGGGAAGRLGVNPFSDRSEVPRSRVRLATSWTGLREPDRCALASGSPDRGQRLDLRMEGEFAPSEALGLFASLPISRVDPSCDRESGVGLGDVELGAKVLPLKGELAKGHAQAQLGASLSLPTGDEELGLSSGAVGGRSFLGASWQRDRLGLFVDGGLAWDFDSDSGLDADGAIGAAYLARPWIGLLFELRGTWTIAAPPRSSFHGSFADEVVEDGDSALYVGPGLTIRPGSNWVIGLTGRAAVAGDPIEDVSVALDVNFLF